jgi:hypothetical protein
MNVKQRNWPAPWPTSSTPAEAILIDRTGRMMDQLDRIEKKVESPPKSNQTGGITIAGAWFKDTKSLILWILIIALLTGHVTMEQVRDKLLDKL